MPAPLYDWDSWMGKKKFFLRRGKDYRCGTGAMTQQIRTAAWKRGLKVTLVEDGSGIHVIVNRSKDAVNSN